MLPLPQLDRRDQVLFPQIRTSSNERARKVLKNGYRLELVPQIEEVKNRSEACDRSLHSETLITNDKPFIDNDLILGSHFIANEEFSNHNAYLAPNLNFDEDNESS